ncbi:uncharacterized protein V2V93DRAFT_206723 [Kockiozyma suomiensis]|uniref:uncharacterized protein n=1 Tax=Kockiozyma suomiensis TaxID=1337062 RepID=UPI00334305E7
MRSMANMFSEPSAVPENDEQSKKLQFHRYSLVGVIISDSSYFIRRRVASQTQLRNLMDVEEHDMLEQCDSEQLPFSYEWFHVEYYEQGEQENGLPFLTRPVNAEQVIEVARVQGLDGVTAIYASDTALDEVNDMLPNPGLELFIKRDNELLDRELSQESASGSSDDDSALPPFPGSKEAASDLISFDVNSVDSASLVELEPEVDTTMADTAGSSAVSTHHLSSGTAIADDDDGSEDAATFLQSQQARIYPRSMPEGHKGPIRKLSTTAVITSEPLPDTGASVHRGSSSGKVKVQHAENASEGEIGDSDEEMLSKMAKK